MKTNPWATSLLVLVLCAGVTLRAQQVDVNSFESIKAKAENGDAVAQCKLGMMYENGKGVVTNLAEAFKWYSKSAEQTNAEAEFHVGICYLTGRGVPPNWTEEEIVELRNRGLNPDWATPIEPTKAVQWFRKSAEQGNAQAQYYLGLCYFNGDGIPKDYAEVVKWFRKAADQGNAEAQFNLGVCYRDGTGVTRDMGEAIKWWLKAANQGLPYAEFNLGSCYWQGIGVNQNYSESLKWIRKAADQGLASAEDSLGILYLHGDHVPQDYFEAVKWFQKAANQGDAESQYNLGSCYFNGDGVTKNYIEADKWINLSSAQGYELAKTVLPIDEKLMTPEQIAEAQKLAREFKPRTESNSDTSAVPENPTATGTGFFITDDGYLISNYHVVKDATRVRLVTGAGTIPAKVVQVDAANDLALLKADGHFAPLPVVSSRAVEMGASVATVGFPDPGLQGFAPKLAKGIVASLSGAQDDAHYFQISVPLQPGNSGGALVDEHGNVVGIVSAKLDASVALAASGALPENVNYAIKSSYLLSFLESVPGVEAKLKAPNTKDETFKNVVKSAQAATVLVLVY